MASKTPAKRGRGRPKAKLTEADLEKLREGGTRSDLAKLVGVSRHTLSKLITEDNTAREAFEAGREHQDDLVMASLLKQAKDPACGRAVAAAQLVMRLRGKLDNDNRTDVNISVTPLPQPVSGKTFLQTMQDVAPVNRAPVTIEHKTEDLSKTKSFAEMLGTRK